MQTVPAVFIPSGKRAKREKVLGRARTVAARALKGFLKSNEVSTEILARYRTAASYFQTVRALYGRQTASDVRTLDLQLA